MKQAREPKCECTFPAPPSRLLWSAFGDTERHQHAGQYRLHHLHRDVHIHVVGGEQVVQVDRTNVTELLEANVVYYRVDSAVGDDLFERFCGGAAIAEVDLVELAGKSDGAVRAMPISSWPLAARRSASARPIPFDAPVIRTRRFDIIFSFPSAHLR